MPHDGSTINNLMETVEKVDPRQPFAISIECSGVNHAECSGRTRTTAKCLCDCHNRVDLQGIAKSILGIK